jgi:hypothetical protein
MQFEDNKGTPDGGGCLLAIVVIAAIIIVGVWVIRAIAVFGPVGH